MYKLQILFFVRLLLLLAFTMTVVGCSSKSGSENKHVSNDNAKEEKPQKGGEAVLGYSTDISNYDPIKSSSGGDQSLLWPVYDTLVTFNQKLEPQPGLAKSWEFTDEKTVVFHLQENVKFHDGTTFDAEAVKFNIERVNSDNSNVSELKNIESVEVVDPLTVKFHLMQPDTSLILVLSDYAGMMVSPTAVKENGDNYSQHPVGAGPYKFVSRVPNGEIVLAAFEDYWQEGKPYLDKMTIKIIADENTRINALKSGEIDLAFNINAANLSNLENDPKIVVKKILGMKRPQLYLNRNIEPFNNKSFRLAVQHGINREALVRSINFGDGEPAYGDFPSGHWAHDNEAKIEYNPKKAKKLLQESGLKNPSFTLLHYSSAYESRLAEAIKGQLKEIGIEVNLQSMELTAAVSTFFAEKGTPAFLASATGKPDPQMLTNSQYSKNSYYNLGGGSQEIDSLLSEAVLNDDLKERAKVYHEIGRQALLEEARVIPLLFPSAIDATSPKLKGYEQNMMAKGVFSTIWLEK
ncbi:ABC transporter substrate-binding protein [Neobacillus rhizophilus]|uniref:ABC transporter substrate-binding protein n=1 Tax=Neobacillus rhizophilus TaxID=2833579 RepID=A0A942UB82_9BACI|nr:ABC transporter substrate-binding protein [Neobacillus rhizophilus]MBS4214179.1 ABC transporter substrate-binding protein [Neobacillus rhizophilus]